MKLLSLQPKSSSKVSRGERELSENDIVELPKGLIPGEWIIVQDSTSKKNYVGYCNPHSLNFYKIKLVHEDKTFEFNQHSNEMQAGSLLIERKLRVATAQRKKMGGYESGARLIFGTNDELPGLIVDKYKKYILIQINTAGIDRYRDFIKSFFDTNYSEVESLLFDNADYRKSEVLPVHEVKAITENLEVLENQIKYLIPSAVVQKIGYYYDHRENRKKLQQLLERMNVRKDSGLDLFSYVGSWGLHMLKAGVRHVDFVDQADMSEVTNTNLKINGFENNGHFTRQDVFKFLDVAASEGKKYDIIVSDPPAFTKSEKNKHTAIQGYEKLHVKAMKLLADEGLMVVASCTHYVSFEELDKTVQEAAFKNMQKIQLLDIGIQGFDHPVSGFKDKSFYIKYMVYSVIRG